MGQATKDMQPEFLTNEAWPILPYYLSIAKRIDKSVTPKYNILTKKESILAFQTKEIQFAS